MGCCGEHRRSAGAIDVPLARMGKLLPAAHCVLCAEKHLSTAYALAQECGYLTPNRQAIIGQLVATQWHLYAEHRELAGKVRDIRHIIQQRKENEIEWAGVLAAVDALAKNEVETENHT